MRSALTVSLCAWVPDLDQLLSAGLITGRLSVAPAAHISVSSENKGSRLLGPLSLEIIEVSEMPLDEVLFIGGFLTFFFVVVIGRGKDIINTVDIKIRLMTATIHVMFISSFASIHSYTSQPCYGLLSCFPDRGWSIET